MTLARVVLRSLLYYRRTGLAVVFGVALATAVLVGALVVGDSVRGSIRDTALSRLGRIDSALVAPHLFRARLADEMQAEPSRPGTGTVELAPILLSRGSVRNAETDAVQPGVQVVGADERFWALWSGRRAAPADGQAAVNASLARDLRLKLGDAILIAVPRQTAVAADNLFAHRRTQDATRAMRAEVAAILPDAGVGGFALDPATGVRRNVFLPREWLASQLGQEGKANALLASGTRISASRLWSRLQRAHTLDDMGLRILPNPSQGYVGVQSDGLALGDRQVQMIEDTAARLGGVPAPTSVYLATAIRPARGGRAVPYSLVATTPPLRPFTLLQGVGASVEPGGVWLNEWTAGQTGARRGDRVEIAYLVPSAGGVYGERTISCTVTGIVRMVGPAADPDLPPVFEGISDARHIGDWNPPFPIDLHRITPADEAYWDRYRATPKAFLDAGALRDMWLAGGSADWLTSVRIAPPRGQSVETFARRLSSALTGVLAPQTAGLVFRPVRRLALEASAGTTDFGGLFIGLGLFVVAAAAGLAGAMMRVRVEQRASHAGLLLACGWSHRQVRRALLAEGALLAGVGAAAGAPLGLGYAAVVLYGLATWWSGATGSAALWLHAAPVSMAEGAVGGFVVGLLAVAWGARALLRLRALDLLGGWQSPAADATRGRGGSGPAVALAAAALGLAAVGALCKGASPTLVFFGAGSCLLAAGILGAGAVLARALAPSGQPPTLARLAVRSAATARARSLLTVGLAASAAFLLVTVAANTRDFGRADYTRRDSGTGGFALIASSSAPVGYDFGTPDGRASLGFAPDDEALFRGVQVVSFLRSPGEDISCLNLARPTAPRILGVPADMVRRGGFTVSASGPARPHPWEALDEPLPDGAMPLFGDSESVMWTLHSALGRDYALDGPDGEPVKARFVGLLAGSVLAGDLLVSREQFRRLYPHVSAPSFFLIATPPGREVAVADALRRNLGDLGVDVKTTREALNALNGVQNAYLSTFTALGGLGLLLGMVGASAVLFENALSRRRELALMSAAGFRTADLAALLARETGGLLLSGLACGVAGALVAVAPQLASAESRVNWPLLLVLLAVIAAAGWLSSQLAARAALRGDLLAALRAE